MTHWVKTGPRRPSSRQRRLFVWYHNRAPQPRGSLLPPATLLLLIAQRCQVPFWNIVFDRDGGFHFSPLQAPSCDDARSSLPREKFKRLSSKIGLQFLSYRPNEGGPVGREETSEC